MIKIYYLVRKRDENEIIAHIVEFHNSITFIQFSNTKNMLIYHNINDFKNEHCTTE